MQRSRIGRNEPCWCGSGKKFKKCHYLREYEARPSHQEVFSVLEKAFSKKYCLHPDADQGKCKGNIVRAHTIQRRGSLSAIAQSGHVIRIFPRNVHDPSKIMWEPESIGINKASTFTGFCSHHDCTTFARIDTQPFSSDPESLLLYAYRSLCRELFMKRGHLELIEGMRDGDKGLPPNAQEDYQEFIRFHGLGVALGVRTMSRQKNAFDSALTAHDYSGMLYCVVEFDRTPGLLCSGTSIVEVDFDGRLYPQLGNPNIWQEIVTFSLLPTERGGAAIFVSLDGGGIARSFLQSIQRIPVNRLANAMVRYATEFYENTFYAPSWWHSLDSLTREKIVLRANSCSKPVAVRDPDCLKEDGINYVAWNVTTIKSNA